MRRTAASSSFVDDYLSYLLARASHRVSREFHAQLKPAGLSVPQWRVLATLVDTPGMSLGALAEAVLFKQPTLTKVIDRMERDGWVGRQYGQRDRRKIRVVITPRGRKVVRGLLVKAKAHERTCLAAFTDAEIAKLKRMLRDLLQRSKNG
ncbi:MAG: MarR family transcriptional regulator [Rhodospirillales bacterium]|nr:MarR family transcriptional regulator [Rhodospirillales bacterium]